MNHKIQESQSSEFLNHLEKGQNQFNHLDFRSFNLSGLNLAGVDFSHSNFQGTNLSGCNLRGAILAGANLRGTNLKSSNLIKAVLTDADLSDANLTRVKLNHADLNRAIFKRVKCYKTILKGVILPDGSIWSGPHFVGGTFSTLSNLKAVEAKSHRQLVQVGSLTFFYAILGFIYFLTKFVI